MPSSNVDLIQNSYEAFARGGIDEYLAFIDPNVNWRAMEGAPDDVGEMDGREAVSRYLREWDDMFEGLFAEAEELIDAGPDRVVAVVHIGGRAKASGAEVDMRYAVLYTLRDGKIVRGREYVDRAQALEAAGVKG